MTQQKYLYHVFLSHNSAQKDWTRLLAERLRKAGLSVFFDEDSIPLGADLFAAIESGLRSSRHILLVLSPEALASKWVALEYSASLYKDPAAADRAIIPIVRRDCELPLILGRLKHLDAQGDDMDRQVSSLLKGIDRVALEESSGQYETPQEQGMEKQAELTSQQRLPAGTDGRERLCLNGPVRPGHGLYVERAADMEVRRAIEEEGSLLVLSGPRKMGKTSLLMHMHDFAVAIGKKPAYVDFQMFRAGTSAPQLYYSFCLRLAEGLVQERPDAEHFILEPDKALAQYMESLRRDAVIICDEYDMLRGIRVLESFSMILRGLHGSGALHQRGASIVLGSWLRPDSFIESQFGSPFNTGEHVRLQPFDRGEAETLIRHVLPAIPAREADALYRLLGGLPYLLQWGLDGLAKGQTVERLLTEALSAEGRFGGYLQWLGGSMGEDTRQQVTKGTLQGLSNDLLGQLDDMGVVCKRGQAYHWTSHLYELAFGTKQS